jgi:prepilin-type N-terminal cleavage/methylation domain-containing protein
MTSPRKEKMGLPPTAKSATGNKGFTFVEVMVALVVLCCGIVLIYKSFFLCADYLNNLTCRLYASSLIDEKIGDIAESFAEWPTKSLEFGNNSVDLVINHKPVRFNYDINLQPLPDVKSVWQVDVKLSWVDGPRNMHAQRSAYMIR